MSEETAVQEAPEQDQADKVIAALGKEKPVTIDDIESVPTPTAEDDIEKQILHKEWHFKADYEVTMGGETETQSFERTYTQKPLSYFAMSEFTGLVGRVISEAMRGPGGLSVDRLMSGAGDIPLEFNQGKISVTGGYDSFDAVVAGVAKLAEYVPDLLGEAQCIWLRVPRNERAIIMDIWARPVDEGGLTMDQGEEMLEIFLEQNYDELADFLQRYRKVSKVVEKMSRRRKAIKGG